MELVVERKKKTKKGKKGSSKGKYKCEYNHHLTTILRVPVSSLLWKLGRGGGQPYVGPLTPAKGPLPLELLFLLPRVPPAPRKRIVTSAVLV